MKRQKVYIGESSLASCREELQKFSGGHVLLIRNKNAYALCGAKDALEPMFSQLNVRVTEFYDFSENPKIEDVGKGLLLISGIGADAIVGIGGGSALDMSKLIRFFHSYVGEITDSKYVRQKDTVPLIVLPTTAGTGSEATRFAVVYKNKVKYSVEHDDVLPDVAVVYPPFTYSAPEYLAACAGFDALAQAIEAYWNVNATEESDGYALKAIESLWTNLPIAVTERTRESRDKVSESSHWAGKAINMTKTTAPHAMSYVFTSRYGIPHGHAVAITFPFWAELNFAWLIENCPDRANKLFALIDMNTADTCNEFVRYLNRLSLRTNVVPEVSSDFVLDNTNMERMSNNPGNRNRNDIGMALKKYFFEYVNKKS